MTELERCEFAKQKGYSYNPKTGELRGMFGKLITGKTGGYVRCIINADKPYSIRGHRLAWYLYYGELPTSCIDHIDGNPLNNKIKNLRDVSQQKNTFNQKAKGYTWHNRANKFQAKIRVNGKVISLGLFDTEPEARTAYLEAKKIYHAIEYVDSHI